MSNCYRNGLQGNFLRESRCGSDEFQRTLLRESRENCNGVESKLNKLLADDVKIISELNDIEKLEREILHEVKDIEEIDKAIFCEVKDIKEIEREVLREAKKIEKKVDEFSDIFGKCKMRASSPFIAEHSELDVTCLNNSHRKKELEINVYDLSYSPKKLIKFDDDDNYCGIKTLEPFYTETFKFKQKYCDSREYLKGKLIEIEVVCKNSTADDILIYSNTKSEEGRDYDNVLLDFAYKCF